MALMWYNANDAAARRPAMRLEARRALRGVVESVAGVCSAPDIGSDDVLGLLILDDLIQKIQKK